MNIKQKLITTLTTTALLLGMGVALAPAANAASCQDPKIFLLGGSSLGDNEKVYSTLPCGFNTTADSQGLFSRWQTTANLQKQSQTYAYGTSGYIKYQVAAKKAIIRDILIFALPVVHIGGNRYNTGDLNELQQQAIAPIANQDLSLARVSHVYKVLIYTQAYLDRDAGISDPAFTWAKIALSVSSGIGDAVEHGLIYATGNAALHMLPLTDFYGTFVDESQNVVNQVSYTTLSSPFRERIETAAQS